MLQRANDEDKGGNEGVGRWGDRGMADYAKDFHNIRCLKFSHNIRPCAAARQREKAEKGRERIKEKKAKKKGERKKKKSGRRHASPWASWDRTLLLVCFSACFSMCILRACMRTARTNFTVQSFHLARRRGLE